MSYTVFALKWRPKNFDEVVGQEHITNTLKNAILKNRLAHAYLFSGPRGVGKTSTARIFAKSLNCKNGPTITPCQSCSSCLEIAQARNLDVIEIDGASNRGIDEIRVLRENVKFAAVLGKFKIYIIDEVHMLTTEAFNALLKTLEEPPEFVKFIFATTQPHKVPSTILSRCQHLGFRRIPLIKIIEQLDKIVASEKLNIDKDVLLAIARASDGSLRDAEALLDQLVSFSKDKVNLGDVISVLGIVEQEALFDITDRIIDKDSKGALELLNNLINAGKDSSLFLTNLIEHFRNLMVAKVSKNDFTLLDLPQDICERLLNQSKAFSLDELLSFFNTLVNAKVMAKRINSLYIPLEITLVKLSQHKIKAENQIVTKPDTARMDNPRENNPNPKKEDNLVIEKNNIRYEQKTVSLDDIKVQWQKIVDNLGKIKMSVATYLNEGYLTNFESDILTISFPRNYSLHKEILEKKENKLMVEKAISESLQSNIRVSFIQSNQEAVKENSVDSPLIKTILDTFKARTIKHE